jgi:hypothetical protein
VGRWERFVGTPSYFWGRRCLASLSRCTRRRWFGRAVAGATRAGGRSAVGASQSGRRVGTRHRGGGGVCARGGPRFDAARKAMGADGSDRPAGEVVGRQGKVGLEHGRGMASMDWLGWLLPLLLSLRDGGATRDGGHGRECHCRRAAFFHRRPETRQSHTPTCTCAFHFFGCAGRCGVYPAGGRDWNGRRCFFFIGHMPVLVSSPI